jgi:uncharacterized protein with GYD domain
MSAVGSGLQPTSRTVKGPSRGSRPKRRGMERGKVMATYVSLIHLTDQGIRNIKDTTKRAKAFVAAAEKAGVKVKELLWTQGTYDLVTITEAADEKAATAVLLAVGAQGNVRSETLRAFTSAEMDAILAKLP